jgi:glucokinase
MTDITISSKRFVVGIDLGGTFVRAGLFDSQGSMLATNQVPIQADRGAEEGLERISALIEETVRGCGRQALDGIGIGATGPVDLFRGVIQNPYTLPGWEEVPIVARLQERFGVPVSLENDADAAALGEYWMGAGKNVGLLVAVTVGTGIGTACIIEGEIYRGLNGAHPEAGHQIIDPAGPQCYCGARGCWEVLASGTAIAQAAQARLAEYPSSALISLAHGEAAQIDARMVAEAALQGDPLACRIIDRAAEYFSLGLINVIDFWVPEVIVLSGGVMKNLKLFLPAIQKAVAGHSVMVPASLVQIVPSALGYHAGLYGAAYTVLHIVDR